jgi:serine/threonine-protein kinase TNNI3K
MLRSSRFVLFAVAAQVVDATKYDIMATYLGTNCSSSQPYIVYTRQNGGCEDGVCYEYLVNQRLLAANERASTECAREDYLQVMRDFYGESPYVIHELYSDDDCSTFEYAVGFLATNSCMGGNQSSGLYYESSLGVDGSASVTPYVMHVGSTGSMEGDSSCSSATVGSVVIDKEGLGNHSCSPLGDISALYDYFTTDSANSVSSFRWYSSNDVESSASQSSIGSTASDSVITDSSGSTVTESRGGTIGTGALTGIIISSALVAVAIILAIIFSRRQFKAVRFDRGFNRTAMDTPAQLEVVMSGQRGLWDDEIITAKRVPRDKVKLKKLISRGAFGEVYNGSFNRQRVAVKVLLPSTRTNLQNVNAFLAEAKLAAVMEHPNIVTFVGVAWDSLSDLCVLLEFMAGGDLRALLNRYEASSHPVGFDAQKITIALHVCHALTYLHSFSPPLIHRDLKSRNILLSKDMDAKLTDFGISRERHDRTMTAGVGTSLWMAPEVMLGERYDDKADMFSFGVVLSELDVHTLPYAHTRRRSRESEGRELADATLFQRVATGEVQVEFSYFSPRSIIKLARACISIDPSERPSAAETLYTLQLVLAKELA